MPKKSSKVEIDERLQRIIEELSIAARWQRPLLVTATCRSEITSRERESKLVQALMESGQPVLHYRVDRIHYDIPLELQQHPRHKQAIFMVRNLRQGGGGGYSNAYRALNMHREYLVEEGIKAIFWLSDGEGRQLARFAPDFWAFRHLVVAFPELPSGGKLPEANADKKREYDAGDRLREGEQYFSLGCYEEALRSHRRALRQKPGEAPILLKIAKVHIALHATNPARRALKQAADGKHFGKELQPEYSRLKTLLKLEQDLKGGCAEG